jgi:Ion channel
LTWLLVELVLVVVSCLGPWPPLVGLLIAAVVFLRIIEIVQVTVNATLLDALKGRADQLVGSTARMLVLAGFNFVELLLCFGIIYATNYKSLMGAGRPVTGFYLSIITQLTIGYGDVYPTGWMRLVAATQGLAGVVFVILVFGRLVASLRPVKEAFDQSEANTEPGRFRYVRIAHSDAGSGHVAIILEREQGNQFDIVLTSDDASRLLDDLTLPIRMASHGSRRDS